MLPSVETLQRLSLVLGVSTDELLGLGRAQLPTAREPAAVLHVVDPRLRRVLRKIKDLPAEQLRAIGVMASALQAAASTKKSRPRS